MPELIWDDGDLITFGGQHLMTGSLDECAEEFLGVVIVVQLT